MSNIQDAVKKKYGAAAKQVAAGKTACCGGGAELSGCDPITRNLYDASEKAALPADAVAASLGCGNPTALAQLQPGETVLDLGSVAASMCCFRPGASVPPAKPMAWT